MLRQVQYTLRMTVQRKIVLNEMLSVAYVDEYGEEYYLELQFSRYPSDQERPWQAADPWTVPMLTGPVGRVYVPRPQQWNPFDPYRGHAKNVLCNNARRYDIWARAEDLEDDHSCITVGSKSTADSSGGILEVAFPPDIWQHVADDLRLVDQVSDYSHWERLHQLLLYGNGIVRQPTTASSLAQQLFQERATT